MNGTVFTEENCTPKGGGNSSFIKKQDFSQIVVDGHESGQLLETPSMSLPCVRPVMYFPLCQLPVIGSSRCFFCPVVFYSSL